MITLSKLTPRDFETFRSWIDSEEELIQFAGTYFTYPLTDEQLHNYINDPQRKAFKVILKETDEVIGNIELNLENDIPRLSRLIIGSKNYRGKQIGKKIILKLLEMAFMNYATEVVDVNVYDWNLTALKCYESVGFEETPEESYSHEMNFKVWTAINMSITRKRWLEMNHQYIEQGQLRNLVDFSTLTEEIRTLVNRWEPKLLSLSSDTITQKRNHQNRSIKQIIGHMIDSASNNHQRMIRLQYHTSLTFPDYQQDNDLWIDLQDYQNAEWKNLIQLWKAYNLHIIQIIYSVNQISLNNSWENLNKQTSTLKQMIEHYPDHLRLHLNEIQELIN